MNRLAALAVIAAVATGGCSSTSDGAKPAAASPEIEIVATDFAFQMPGEVAAGEIKQTLRNEGEFPHQALFYRLKDGVEFDDFKRQMMRDESVIPQMTDVAGGVSRVVSPGGTATSSDEIEPGTYAVICFAHVGSAPKNHSEIGMVDELVVR